MFVRCCGIFILRRPVFVSRSPDVAPPQMLVLEAISGLCRDPLALVEMFVNYDCDLQAIDLFKRIVTALAKVGCHTFIVIHDTAIGCSSRIQQ